MPSDWYVVIDGKASGPLDDSQIRTMASDGRITVETLVCRAGMKQWAPAKQIKGLFSAGQTPVRSIPASPPRPPLASPVHAQSLVGVAHAANEGPVSINTRPYSARYIGRPDYTVNTLLGCSGAAALLLGFFCPILRLPIIGSMSYLGFIGLLVRDGAVSEMTISAFLVIAAVLVALIAAIAKQPALFWMPGVAGCLAALLTLGKYFWLQTEMARKMKQDLEGNPFAGLAQAMVQAVALDFGIGVILIGAALIIAGAVVPVARRG